MDKKTLTEEEALFIRSICRRSFDRNIDLANDCFLYVWEKLHENGSRRIRAFRGGSSFRTFLYSVTNKLVIDFRRTRFGYKVLPRYYWEFDEINRYIFKLFFYQNLTSEWVENSIRAEFKISQGEAERRVNEVERRIRESRLQMERMGGMPLVLLGEGVDTVSAADRRENPEEDMITAEVERKRERILKELKEEIQGFKDEDVLVLQLYFEHGLTAKEVAGAVPGVSQKNVYKRIERMIRRLRARLQEKGISQEDINDIFERLT
jgi:RNA polymerase sigma factor (sigma-70 family)